MRYLAIAVAACAASEPAPPPVQQVVATVTADAAVPVHEPEVIHTIPSGTASDDFPHRQNEMRVALAGTDTCVPKFEPPNELEMPDHHIALALDAIGGDLVLCAQVLTRRDVSVFLDMVSYGCWNLDPRTAFLTRRRDLGRSYFDCQDGTCVNDTSEISYDGKSRVDVGNTDLRVVDRESGAIRTTITTDFDVHKAAFFHGDLVYLSGMLFAHVDDNVFVYDDHGAKIATLPGRIVHVVSDHVVTAITDIATATVFDLKTRATRKLSVPECSELAISERQPRCMAAAMAAHFNAVEFRGALYAIDEAKRQLVIVDPATYRPRSTKQLAICK